MSTLIKQPLILTMERENGTLKPSEFIAALFEE